MDSSIAKLRNRAEALSDGPPTAETAALLEELARRAPGDGEAQVKAMNAWRLLGEVQKAADAAERALFGGGLDKKGQTLCQNLLFRANRWEPYIRFMLAEGRREAGERGADADRLLIVANRLKRGGVRDDRSPELGLYAMEAAGAVLGGGVPYFEGKTILDVGCGHKQAEAIVKFEVPVRRYVGIDSYRPLMEVLAAQTNGSSNLEFHHIDAFNQRYSPTGKPMVEDMRLPFPDAEFDLIHAWSLFSHLNADDTQTYFHVLRRYAHQGTDFFFTLFLEPGTETWRDSEEGQPLLRVRYGPEYMDSLLRRAGWAVKTVATPEDLRGPWPASWPVHGLDLIPRGPDDMTGALHKDGQSCIVARPIS